jgi:hypothetical protein
MVLTIFSIKISITKEKITTEQAQHNEQVKKIFEENQRKVEQYTRFRQF